MKSTTSECGHIATASVSISNEPTVNRSNIQVVHIRIDSDKSYDEVRTSLESLPRFDDGIRALLHYGETARAIAELTRIQGEAGLVIFSTAAHGEWLQIVSGRRPGVQYLIGNVLVSTQMTRHRLAAGLYAPHRIMLYEGESGNAVFEYDRPSTLFGQYGNECVTAVANELDQKILAALIKAAR